MEKIETYRSREENISAALMNAQHQADLVVREAEHRSEAMLQDAEQKAEHILAQAKNKIEEEDMSLQSLKKEIASFKSKLMSLYKEHLMLIDALPGEEKDSDQPPVQEDRTPQPEKEISPQEEAVESITKGQSSENQEEVSPVISSTEETVLGGEDMLQRWKQILFRRMPLLPLFLRQLILLRLLMCRQMLPSTHCLIVMPLNRRKRFMGLLLI